MRNFDHFMHEKEIIVQRIKKQRNSAAARLCDVPTGLQDKEHLHDVIGLVALLGFVPDNNLSRQVLRRYFAVHSFMDELNVVIGCLFTGYLLNTLDKVVCSALSVSHMNQPLHLRNMKGLETKTKSLVFTNLLLHKGVKLGVNF